MEFRYFCLQGQACRLTNFAIDLLYVLSTSAGKKQAGSSPIPQWYLMQSQHFPFLLHGSYVQLQSVLLASMLHSIWCLPFDIRRILTHLTTNCSNKVRKQSTKYEMQGTKNQIPVFVVVLGPCHLDFPPYSSSSYFAIGTWYLSRGVRLKVWLWN